MTKFVKVIDGYPGIGKSSWAIQKINNSIEQKILYIVPLLDEVDRIAKECPNINFYKPSERIGRGIKMNDLINLVNDERNIVTTHQLIDRTEKDLIEALRGKPIDRQKEGLVHFVGFALLMLLMIVVTWNDIQRFFLQ